MNFRSIGYQGRTEKYGEGKEEKGKQPVEVGREKEREGRVGKELVEGGQQ